MGPRVSIAKTSVWRIRQVSWLGIDRGAFPSARLGGFRRGCGNPTQLRDSAGFAPASLFFPLVDARDTE